MVCGELGHYLETAVTDMDMELRWESDFVTIQLRPMRDSSVMEMATKINIALIYIQTVWCYFAFTFQFQFKKWFFDQSMYNLHL